MEPLLKEIWSDVRFYIESLRLSSDGQTEEPFRVLHKSFMLCYCFRSPWPRVQSWIPVTVYAKFCLFGLEWCLAKRVSWCFFGELKGSYLLKLILICNSLCITAPGSSVWFQIWESSHNLIESAWLSTQTLWKECFSRVLWMINVSIFLKDMY